MSVLDRFHLDGRVAVITGGCGLLGRQHAAAIASAGGIPVLLDIERADPPGTAAKLAASLARRATATLRTSPSFPRSSS